MSKALIQVKKYKKTIKNMTIAAASEDKDLIDLEIAKFNKSLI